MAFRCRPCQQIPVTGQFFFALVARKPRSLVFCNEDKTLLLKSIEQMKPMSEIFF
jgi:hypothetical protein